MIETSPSLAPLPQPKLRRRGFLYEIIETVILIAAIYALVDMASVRFFVDGPSMEPTFVDEQRIIVSRAHYMFAEPQRGEIIVFNSPDRPGIDAPLIKRLLGLPGETVEIRDTRFYINGQLLDEPYFVNAPCEPNKCRDRVWELGEDEYFVAGDNRNRSRDSRDFGSIRRELIIGQAIVRYWEPQDWALLYKYGFPEDPFPNSTLEN